MYRDKYWKQTRKKKKEREKEKEKNATQNAATERCSVNPRWNFSDPPKHNSEVKHENRRFEAFLLTDA